MNCLLTQVVNLRNDPYDVFIGRGSKWGNPFVIGQDGTRDEVIEQYEHWIKRFPDLLAALPELKNKRLGCYCKPKKCHGDILIKLLNEQENK